MQSAKEKKHRKRHDIILLLLLILSISCGYAILCTSLNINGISRINNATWDIHFENAEATPNSNVIPSIAPIASATEKTTTITYTVELEKPGDIYEFTVDVANRGSIDAKLATDPLISGVSTAQDVYTNYTFTHANGQKVQAGEIIEANSAEKFKVKVEYDKDITQDQLPLSPQTLTLTVVMNYTQA